MTPADLLARAGEDGSFWLVLRGGARPLALKAHLRQPVWASMELARGEVEGFAEPLHVGLEETAFVAEPAARVGRVRDPAFARLVRKRVALDVDDLYGVEHGATKSFVQGTSPVPYAGRVYDAREIQAAVSASLDFWLTLGPHGDRFQRQFAQFLGVRASVFANSGSSANLLAFASLTSSKLGDRAIRPGDEVITCAAAFPTTVNPIVQCGAIPVFVDCDPRTGNLDPAKLEEAISPRTRAIMAAHTLGNPFDLDRVGELCRRHGLWLIEDNCDALGSRWKGQLTGTFGDLSTQSFYPAHHLTTGEGGMVNVVSDAKLKPIVESFRDWGRDCWCDSGKSNTCGKRFAWSLGELPEGYDHKYSYTHVGYNLKPLDIQAAIGEEQLRKLPAFGEARRRNWSVLREGLRGLEEWLVPTEATPGSDPSWFGFMVHVADRAPFTRRDIVAFLEERKIETRMLFGGNLTRQPAYTDLKRTDGSRPFRVVGDLSGADRLMNQAFFVGVYPGLSAAQLDYLVQSFRDFARQRGIA